MPTVHTELEINASPQTVWSVLDDLPRYPEWNPVVPKLDGRTTLGERVVGELVIQDMQTPPLTPRINRVVAVREFRWISEIPGDKGFTAEHIFELTASPAGTHLVHPEIFEGPASPAFVAPIEHNIRPSYESFNQALKERAECFERADVRLHPSVDDGLSTAASTPLTLSCHCASHPVLLQTGEAVSHNHLCGCLRCWKPDGAFMAQIAVVPAGVAMFIAGREKLVPVDEAQATVRFRCVNCSVHMIGHVVDRDHHFYGVDFVHPELAIDGSCAAPEFAGFVSSLIESRCNASLSSATRKRLAALGVPAYDTFSPELNDTIAYHRVKLRVASSPA